MTDISVTTPTRPDGVKLSEITAILQEEHFLEPERLPSDITFGQARGIAGRKRTQLIRRLRDLGFIEGRPPGDASNPQGKINLDCDIIWAGDWYLKCHLSISIG